MPYHPPSAMALKLCIDVKILLSFWVFAVREAMKRHMMESEGGKVIEAEVVEEVQSGEDGKRDPQIRHSQLVVSPSSHGLLVSV